MERVRNCKRGRVMYRAGGGGSYDPPGGSWRPPGGSGGPGRRRRRRNEREGFESGAELGPVLGQGDGREAPVRRVAWQVGDGRAPGELARDGARTEAELGGPGPPPEGHDAAAPALGPG